MAEPAEYDAQGAYLSMHEPPVSTTYTEFAGMLDELFGPPTVGDSRPPALHVSGQNMSSEQSFLVGPGLEDPPASLQFYPHDNSSHARVTHESFPDLSLAQRENQFSSSSPYFDHRSPGLSSFDPMVAPLAHFTDAIVVNHGPYNALTHVNTFPAAPVGTTFGPLLPPLLLPPPLLPPPLLPPPLYHHAPSSEIVLQARDAFSYVQGHPDFGPPCTCPHGRPCGMPRDRYEGDDGPRPLVLVTPPVGFADGPVSEKVESGGREPLMFRCEWEGKCGACIAPDQVSVNRHLRTHITEELAKLMSGGGGAAAAADTLMNLNGKPKVRYLFDPSRSGFSSGIQLDDIEVGARVRIVMEKGKVWARCLWGADGCCVHSRGELTMEYLPRHVWVIHLGMSR